MPKVARFDDGWGWPPATSRQRWPSWRTVLAAVAVAFMGAFAGSLLTPGLPYRAIDAIAREIEGPPPRPLTRDVIVRAYVAQTREAQFWAKKPTIFPPAVRSFRSYFASFDPRRAHPYRESAFKLWIPELIATAPLYLGNRVEFVGEIATANVLWPMSRSMEWVVQLRPITTEGGLVYCRITLPLATRPVPGRIVTISGLVLAVGSIELVRGGSTNGAYVVGTAMRRPRGWLGRVSRYAEQHPRKLERFRKAVNRGEL